MLLEDYFFQTTFLNYLVTFNIILSDIFPENFIEIHHGIFRIFFNIYLLQKN